MGVSEQNTSKVSKLFLVRGQLKWPIAKKTSFGMHHVTSNYNTQVLVKAQAKISDNKV
jgi:hypothetical protein